MWTGEQSIEDAFRNLILFRLTLRRHWIGLGLWTLVCVAVGGAYVHVTTPEFIASVRVMLQPRSIASDGSEDVRQAHQIDLDGLQAETELQVIRSERVLRYAFDRLHLADDGELRSGHDGVWSDLFAVLHRFAVGASEADQEAESFDRFVGHVRTMRLGRSYVLDISYLGPSAQKAVRVANAIASAYLRERVRASAGAQAGSSNLNQRIAAVATQVDATSDAVAEGTVPALDLPDSGVRILGAAVEPGAKAYPRLGPVLLIAAAFGLVTGVLVLSRLRPAATPARP